MAQDLVERKVRLSPEANARWERFEEEWGITVAAFLEAAALVQTQQVDGLSVSEKSHVSVYAWFSQVIDEGRLVMKQRRSRKSDGAT